MATMMMSNHYASQASAHYAYGQPQGPPSPPMDDNKCSLPSISNLLGLADGGSPTSETSQASVQGMWSLDHTSPKFSPLTYTMHSLDSKIRHTTELFSLQQHSGSRRCPATNATNVIRGFFRRIPLAIDQVSEPTAHTKLLLRFAAIHEPR